MRAFFPVVFLAAGIAGHAVAYAQVNKCVDSSGRVVGYGSECPAGTRPEATGIRSSPPAAGPAAPKSMAEQEAEFRKRQIEKREAEAKAEKLAADDKARAGNCESARSYLKSLKTGLRITRTDPNTGEHTVLGDADYPREVAKAQRAIEANCK